MVKTGKGIDLQREKWGSPFSQESKLQAKIAHSLRVRLIRMKLFSQSCSNGCNLVWEQSCWHLFNKLASVFYASVLLLMINCVLTLSKWLWNHEPKASGSVVNFDNVMMQLASMGGQSHKKNWHQFVFYNNKTPKWSNTGDKWMEKTL